MDRNNKVGEVGMNITVARFLLENNVYKDRGMVRIPTVYYDQIMDALKEQEAVEPKQIGQGWFCGACDALLLIGNAKMVKFCSMCGKPIDWEGR